MSKDTYAKQIKKTHIDKHGVCLGGKVVDIISQLTALEAEYPGCYLEWYYEESSFYYDKEETDEEYAERMLRLQAEEAAKLTRKRAQYEKLKKELELDNEQ